MADFDIAEYLGTGAQKHAAADFRVAVAHFLPRAAERHALQHGNVVLDDDGRADDDSRRMVEENALADHSGGVDVDLKDFGRAALQVEREIAPSGLPQGMGEAVRLEGMKALEVKQRLDEPRAGGIAVEYGHGVGPERLADQRILAQDVHVDLPDKVAGEVAVFEPYRDAMDDDCLQRVVIEHVGEHERAEVRLVVNRLLRLEADARQDWIVAAEVNNAGGALSGTVRGHRYSSGSRPIPRLNVGCKKFPASPVRRMNVSIPGAGRQTVLCSRGLPQGRSSRNSSAACL